MNDTRPVRTKEDYFEVSASVKVTRRIFAQTRPCGYAGVQHEDLAPNEEFRTGADYSQEYAEAMAHNDVRRAGYGGIVRDHDHGADHGTYADLVAQADEPFSERCDWAFKEPKLYQPPKLISNEFRTESMSLPAIEREAYAAFDYEPDPLDVLCRLEDEI